MIALLGNAIFKYLVTLSEQGVTYTDLPPKKASNKRQLLISVPAIFKKYCSLRAVLSIYKFGQFQHQ